MTDSLRHHLSSWPAFLLAQAGGGGSFGGSGGGGGGGFGGGGGGGDGEAIAWLIWLTFRYPQYGIPAWVVVGALFWFGRKVESDRRVTRTIRRGRKVQEQDLRESALAAISERDAAFSEDVFLKRVKNGFVTTQSAWSDQDLRPCRPFISDGVRERFELYIAMQQAENIRNRMREVVVLEATLVSVTSDQHFDTIHVRITASAISYNEDLTTGKRVSGNSDRTPITFTEVWSFSRRPGVLTNPGASLMQGRCPQCGGPLEIVDKAECPQCTATVNSGRYDWVLSEITQDEEWVVPAAKQAVPGWSALQSADPGLNVQHLEDRASVIFWRSLMAVWFDDFRYAAPVLHSDATRVPPLWNRGEGEFWKTPAVGGVEVLQCVPADDDEFDRVLILVRWSATRASGDRRDPRLLDEQRIYSHVLILRRRQGTTSNADRTFASSTCSGCGAPIDPGTTAACRFCGSPLNDGTGDWVLEDVAPRVPAHIQALRQRRTTTPAGDERLEADRFVHEPELLEALCGLLAADGELHEKERAHIREFAEKRGVSVRHLKSVFAAVQKGDGTFSLPADRQQAGQFMDQLIRAALVDGRLTRPERDLLLRAARQIGWSSADLKLAVNRTRTELYQQARKLLRPRRR